MGLTPPPGSRPVDPARTALTVKSFGLFPSEVIAMPDIRHPDPVALPPIAAADVPVITAIEITPVRQYASLEDACINEFPASPGC
jgi:hypothetical protein